MGEKSVEYGWQIEKPGSWNQVVQTLDRSAGHLAASPNLI
jgi:hypothetical protein